MKQQIVESALQLIEGLLQEFVGTDDGDELMKGLENICDNFNEDYPIDSANRSTTKSANSIPGAVYHYDKFGNFVPKP